jgi:hypothetical protein
MSALITALITPVNGSWVGSRERVTDRQSYFLKAQRLETEKLENLDEGQEQMVGRRREERARGKVCSATGPGSMGHVD